MEGLAAAPSSVDSWARRRRRARQLLERHPFAAQLLRLYGVLLDAQERAFLMTLDDRPDPTDVAAYVADHVMADVVENTVVAGPPALAAAARDRLAEGGLEAPVARWLGGEQQSPVDEYLARAAAVPVLEALGPAAGRACRRSQGAGGCPRCGGRPQLSYLADSGEPLVTAPRALLCCRCGASFIHERMMCPACGERSSARLPIYADDERFPHVRVDACATCRRYLLTLDLRRDPEAVPIVDELAALPLDLYAQERGFAKIVPNLLGIG